MRPAVDARDPRDAPNPPLADDVPARDAGVVDGVPGCPGRPLAAVPRPLGAAPRPADPAPLEDRGAVLLPLPGVALDVRGAVVLPAGRALLGREAAPLD